MSESLTLHRHVASHTTTHANAHHGVHTGHRVHAHATHGGSHSRHTHHVRTTTHGVCTTTATAHTSSAAHTAHHVAAVVVESVVLHSAHRGTREATHHGSRHATLVSTHGIEVVAVVKVVHVTTHAAIVEAASAAESATGVVAVVGVATGVVGTTTAAAGATSIARRGILGQSLKWVLVGAGVDRSVLTRGAAVSLDVVLSRGRCLRGTELNKRLTKGFQRLVSILGIVFVCDRVYNLLTPCSCRSLYAR